jgi:competence ComEA-like helix-hairpin-helix protein
MQRMRLPSGHPRLVKVTVFLVLVLLLRLYLRAVEATLGRPTAELSSVVLDLNAASADELMLLEGIGPARARAIVEDRERRGPFHRVEELVRVQGIGPQTVAAIRASLVISARPGESRPEAAEAPVVAR